MHHFFISPDSFKDGQIILRGGQAHQIRDVLRLRAGEEITALDNSGGAFRVVLEKVGDQVSGSVIERIELESEPHVRIVLCQALLKADKMEWVLQKGTEIGIAEFIPIVTERSVSHHVSESKEKRWRKILTESSEQARRAKIPLLGDTMGLGDAIEQAKGSLILVPFEGEHTVKLSRVLEAHPSKVTIFIGPEGGFTGNEIDQARVAGAQTITLGPRILRSETAGLFTASAILFAFGEI